MKQITFNNRKSYDDFGFTIESYSIQPPSKKKIKEAVPFMNGSYDFSTVGSSGEIVYTERDISLVLNLHGKSRAHLLQKYSEALEWLIGTGKSPLIISDIPDVFFSAEVENAPSFETVLKRNGKLGIVFVADPFKSGNEYEGDKLWDTFNFETDYLQDTVFTVGGSRTATIYNPGRTVIPVINCSAAMTVKANGYTLNCSKGDNRDYRLKLLNGANTVTINGTGTVKINFRKELL